MDIMPTNYFQAPFVGNGLLGAMLWQESETELRLEIGRMDVTDHRTGAEEAIVLRGRLPIGHFTLATRGKITGGTARLRLHDAEAVGAVTTDRGSLSWRLLTHTRLPVIIMEVTASGAEAARWEWKPDVSVVRRKPNRERTNPPPKLSTQENVQISLQQRTIGDYCTAWVELPAGDRTRRLLVTVADDFPRANSDQTAVATIRAARDADFAKLLQEHREWWHDYYPASFVSVPDRRMESFYWIQMYKLGSSIRQGGPLCDLMGPWYKPSGWPGIWFNLNSQVLYWPFATANRLDMLENLSRALERNLAGLTNSLPKELQHDSAAISRCTGTDLEERFDRWKEYGNLTWLCHDLWLQYRYSMDDGFLRHQLYPLLRRAMNLYLHVLTRDASGQYHMPPAHCPESFTGPDNNYDLSCIRWGCDTLLASCERLKLQDELIPIWKEVRQNLVAFPTDTNGFCGGPNKPAPRGHRHWSHLLMIYPFYTVNWDQPENRDLITRSWQYWADPQVPNAWSQGVMSSMASAIGDTTAARQHMQLALNSRNLAPNTMHTEGGNPCSETHGLLCQMLHDMLLQSWGGRIRIFPGAPAAWSNIVFHDLRTEGAFLVSAERRDGKTDWIRIKSLAGEPCRIKPGFTATPKLHINGQPAALESLGEGVYEIPLRKGDESLLFYGNPPMHPTIKPLAAQPKDYNSYGLRLHSAARPPGSQR